MKKNFFVEGGNGSRIAGVKSQRNVENSTKEASSSSSSSKVNTLCKLQSEAAIQKDAND